ncbi:MAG: betaine/proline/choline family ABC transporter ATP-binding protein [Dehalococcoidia bacterium]
MDLLNAGVSKEDILKQTKSVVGVVDVSIEVSPGEIFVVMGLSGSGKSTLIRCINRLYEPTAGTILIDDVNVTQADRTELRNIRRSKVSMVFQHFALFPHKSVYENVEYGLKVQNVSEEERRDRSEEALQLIGLGGWGDYKPESLSGGMQQRVGLARALASGSEVLLMDEAFSALDPLIKREMQDELLNIHDKLGRTIIFITHDLNEALKLGDRTAIMRDGSVEQIGNARQIIDTPSSEYIHDFVRDVDRGRVLTLNAVIRKNRTLDAREFSVDTALSLLNSSEEDLCCLVTKDGKPERCLSSEAVQMAADAGVVDYMDIGMPVQVAPVSTLLQQALTPASEGHCVVALNRLGELVGHADPTDILGALTVADYTEAKSAIAGPG